MHFQPIPRIRTIHQRVVTSNNIIQIMLLRTIYLQGLTKPKVKLCKRGNAYPFKEIYENMKFVNVSNNDCHYQNYSQIQMENRQFCNSYKTLNLIQSLCARLLVWFLQLNVFLVLFCTIRFFVIFFCVYSVLAL